MPVDEHFRTHQALYLNARSKTYPDDFRDALIDYGLDPDPDPRAHEHNERLQELAEAETDIVIFRARVPDLYAEIFGEGPDDGY